MSLEIKPRGLFNGAVVQELDDELLIYNTETHQAHCLNSTLAKIWNLCDGSRTVEKIRLSLGEKLKMPVSEELVSLAL